MGFEDALRQTLKNRTGKEFVKNLETAPIIRATEGVDSEATAESVLSKAFDMQPQIAAERKQRAEAQRLREQALQEQESWPEAHSPEPLPSAPQSPSSWPEAHSPVTEKGGQWDILNASFEQETASTSDETLAVSASEVCDFPGEEPDPWALLDKALDEID